jgi:transposase
MVGSLRITFPMRPNCRKVGRRKERTRYEAYSQDLREHVLRAVDLGRERCEIAQVFGVSLATIKRYLKQRQEEGHVRPKAIPGRPPKKRAQVEAGVMPQLQAHDDATLAQHCDLWEQVHGEHVSRWTMSRAIKRLGWTRKKVVGGDGAQRRGAGRQAARTRASFQQKRWCFLMSAVPTLP